MATSEDDRIGRQNVSDVMLYTVEHMRETQMWVLGADMRDRKGSFSAKEFVTLDGRRTKLDVSFLGMVGLSMTRRTESFSEYYLPERTYAVARANETNDSFARVHVLSKDTLATWPNQNVK